MYTVGATHSAIFGDTIKTVVIRSIVSKRLLEVSLGFDTKGNDITCLIQTNDIR